VIKCKNNPLHLQCVSGKKERRKKNWFIHGANRIVLGAIQNTGNLEVRIEAEITKF
jgi:hypothetical protein